jgi:type II secretion system protein C
VLLLLISVITLFFMRKALPPRRSLAPAPVIVSPKKRISPIDLNRIYENDLFRTYQKPLKPVQPPPVDITLPQPPPPIPVPRLQPPHVQFLDPLKVSLKGIISSSEEKDNRAIIADEKTKKEDIYGVGDTIEDAEILRIETNKVILIRSNGQQEVLFLNHAAAAADPLYSRDTAWSAIVKKVGDSSFVVDPRALKERIRSVAQFMNMLDITTALNDQGISIGCRIGRTDPASLGPTIGLQYDDIITNINAMPVTTTQERVAVFQALKSLPLGSPIRVKLLRKQREHELVFVLNTLSQPEASAPTLTPAPAPAIAPPGNLNQTLPPAPPFLSEAQRRSKAAMREYGGQAAALRRI